MIKLNIEDYCRDCPEFEARTDKLYVDGQVLLTYVYCEHQDICEHIHDHLLKKLKENKNVKEEN